MNSKFTTRALIIRLLIFATLVSGLSFAVLSKQWELAVFAGILSVVSAFTIITFVNGIYRKLHYFFAAVKNEDGSLYFPDKGNSKHIKGLDQHLNRINQVINEIKTKQAQNEQFFMAFMQRSASGLLAVDDKGFVELVNDAALKLMGLKNISHLDRLNQVQPALYDLMQKIKPGQSESLKIADGARLRQLALKKAKISFSDKEYRVFSFYDIKNEMEENELETWQKLIRIMTHEIMNSIAPITSLSQTLSSFFTEDGQNIDASDINQEHIENTILGLSVIGERAEGLQSFVANYRKLSRLPHPEFKEIDLENWLDSIRLLFESQRQEFDIDFKILNNYPNPTFLGDEKLLTHVILNLLNNATEALKEGSSKSIILSLIDNGTRQIQIKVKDNGIGFKPEEADKIFLPFYTTRENGSGIGLSLSRQIMRLHKGSISAKSVYQEGSEFTIEL